MFKYGWGLKFPPNAEHSNLMLFQGGEIGMVTEDNTACSRFDFATDDIEQCCLASAIWTNKGTQLATINVQIYPSHHLEALKTHGNVFEINNTSLLLHPPPPSPPLQPSPGGGGNGTRHRALEKPGTGPS